MKFLCVFFCCLFFLPWILVAQFPLEKRQIQARKISGGVHIDGKLEEEVWQQAEVASGFVQYDPRPGAPASQKTEVRVLYDNRALYIGARLYDTHPDSILNELSQRDELGNADYFGVVIDTYRDGLNGLGFIATPAGVEYDLKYSALGGGFNPRGPLFAGDRQWDAVWQLRCRIDEQGWVVEMAIPYSALRFPSVEVQSWGINFARHLRRKRETSYWNPVNPDEQGLLRQSGLLTGLQNIKAPVRLSATPFLAGSLERFRDPAQMSSSSGHSFKAGMDVKYGISDAFTLDMTLIPDFGEARSDDQVLNLSPFEVRFDENRQFFIEGAELFNKGNLFYSRRIGSIPSFLYSTLASRLSANDSLLYTPRVSQLINATKISGRTSGGTGLGVFNAVTAPTYAEVEDLSTGETREEELAPLTNFNILVLDQNLPNNSYFTLINTNVWRSGSAYEANQTGLVYDLRNRTNDYALKGKIAVSQQFFSEKPQLGHTFDITLADISNPWSWSVGYDMDSDTYDPNDLAFLRRNNQQTYSVGLGYRQTQPFQLFKKGKSGKEFYGGGFFLDAEHERLFHPNVFTEQSLSFFSWLVTSRFLVVGLNGFWRPVVKHDYFEARTAGRVFLSPTFGSLSTWISTDYRKPVALDMSFRMGRGNRGLQNSYSFNVSPRFRLSDRFNFSLDVSDALNFNEQGYAGEGEQGEIVFGYRDVHTVETGMEVNYNFNPRLTFNFRLRHYWSAVHYRTFHSLLDDGSLGAELETDLPEDNDFNAFNIDAVFRWRFAPGSDFFFIWKNSILDFEYAASPDQTYWRNALGLSHLPRSNTFTLKAIYYLDYLMLRG